MLFEFEYERRTTEKYKNGRGGGEGRGEEGVMGGRPLCHCRISLIEQYRDGTGISLLLLIRWIPIRSIRLFILIGQSRERVWEIKRRPPVFPSFFNEGRERIMNYGERNELENSSRE